LRRGYAGTDSWGFQNSAWREANHPNRIHHVR